jgi:hypothetical protein
MNYYSFDTARRFAAALETISPKWQAKQNKSRHLANISDSLERMVTGSILREALTKYLDSHVLAEKPQIVFMDRKGGGKNMKTIESVIELLGSRLKGCSFIHIAFATPPKGVGTLLGSSLARKGAESGVAVEVVAQNKPAEGLEFTIEQTEELLQEASLVITYAPDGIAGLLPMNAESPDPLIKASHLCVLTFPDPEHVVADLPRYEEVIAQRPGFNKIRFKVQTAEKNREFKTLDFCTLSANGDAHEKLWRLLDNARRLNYRLLAEPIAHDVPVGRPLYCPCKALLKSTSRIGTKIDKIIPAGSDLVLTGTKF